MFEVSRLIKIVELGLGIYKDKLAQADPEVYKSNAEIMFYEMDKDPLKRDMAAFDEARRENALLEEKLMQVLLRELSK